MTHKGHNDRRSKIAHKDLLNENFILTWEIGQNDLSHLSSSWIRSLEITSPSMSLRFFFPETKASNLGFRAAKHVLYNGESSHAAEHKGCESVELLLLLPPS
jgi:hypothetical protein